MAALGQYRNQGNWGRQGWGVETPATKAIERSGLTIKPAVSSPSAPAVTQPTIIETPQSVVELPPVTDYTPYDAIGTPQDASPHAAMDQVAVGVDPVYGGPIDLSFDAFSDATAPPGASTAYAEFAGNAILEYDQDQMYGLRGDGMGSWLSSFLRGTVGKVVTTVAGAIPGPIGAIANVVGGLVKPKPAPAPAPAPAPVQVAPTPPAPAPRPAPTSPGWVKPVLIGGGILLALKMFGKK